MNLLQKIRLGGWNINSNSNQQCKERDFLLKCCTKETDPIKEDNLYATYKNIRNAITRSKRDSKTLYFSQFFEKNRAKSSEIWKGIRSLVNIKPSKY